MNCLPASITPNSSQGQQLTELLHLSLLIALGSWADDVDALPTSSAGFDLRTGSGGRNSDRSSGAFGDRADREPRREPVFPDRPPYTAFIGNLSFEVTENDIHDLFTGLKIKSVRLQRGPDDRPKGFGYCEFEDVESLKKAVSHHGENFCGRTVRVDVSESREPPRRQTSFRDDQPSASEGSSDWRRRDAPPPSGGSDSGRPSFPDRRASRSNFSDRTSMDDRRSSRGSFSDYRGPDDRGSERSGFGDRGGFSDRGGFGDRGGFRDRDSGSRGDRDFGFRNRPAAADKVPEKLLERRKLQLQPRTVDDGPAPAEVASPVEKPDVPSPVEPPKKPKSNPFGDAKPRDDAEINKRIEERLKEKEEAELAAKKAAKEEARKQKEAEAAARAAEAEAARKAKEDELERRRLREYEAQQERERAEKAKAEAEAEAAEQRKTEVKVEGESLERQPSFGGRGRGTRGGRGGFAAAGSARGGSAGRGGFRSERAEGGSWRREDNAPPPERPQPTPAATRDVAAAKAVTGPARGARPAKAPVVLEGPKEVKVDNPFALLGEDGDVADDDEE
ncbi:hypothetical protein DFJ73DRAFT_47370 [Zopfochytrium polystomum]|nr:hypothetical protein DFJ73DRAFT_47370 [Zopfochytrium polystomum]